MHGLLFRRRLDGPVPCGEVLRVGDGLRDGRVDVIGDPRADGAKVDVERDLCQLRQPRVDEEREHRAEAASVALDLRDDEACGQVSQLALPCKGHGVALGRQLGGLAVGLDAQRLELLAIRVPWLGERAGGARPEDALERLVGILGEAKGVRCDVGIAHVCLERRHRVDVVLLVERTDGRRTEDKVVV
eukprot:scaffold106594_cov69-Phaeocystis_antarctica.AAC.4